MHDLSKQTQFSTIMKPSLNYSFQSSISIQFAWVYMNAVNGQNIYNSSNMSIFMWRSYLWSGLFIHVNPLISSKTCRLESIMVYNPRIVCSQRKVGTPHLMSIIWYVKFWQCATFLLLPILSWHTLSRVIDMTWIFINMHYLPLPVLSREGTIISF